MLNHKFLSCRRLLIFLLSFCFAIAVHVPVQSQVDGQGLSFQAQQLYQSGELPLAATAWQQAAKRFEEQGDRLSRTKSLINQSQVLQDLGLYPHACRSILQAFDLAEYPQCETAQIEELRQTLEQQSMTIIDGIGLRSLGGIMQKQGLLAEAQKLLQLSAIATRNSPEQGATFLAQGNVQQALGNQIRDRWSYDRVTEIIDRQEPSNALQPYQQAFKAYTASAQQGDLLTQTQAQLNHLALLIEIEAWWQPQTSRRVQSWQRLEQTMLVNVADNFTALLATELDQKRTRLIEQIRSNLLQLPPTAPGIYAHLNYAQSLSKLAQTTVAESILQTALQQAQLIRDQRSESYALGYLGENYGRQ
ncbi:MAG: hypothetical protein AAFR77_18595, partial [Cyanobacteria bacterium J06631_2]